MKGGHVMLGQFSVLILAAVLLYAFLLSVKVDKTYYNNDCRRIKF